MTDLQLGILLGLYLAGAIWTVVTGILVSRDADYPLPAIIILLYAAFWFVALAYVAIVRGRSRSTVGR